MKKERYLGSNQDIKKEGEQEGKGGREEKDEKTRKVVKLPWAL